MGILKVNMKSGGGNFFFRSWLWSEAAESHRVSLPCFAAPLFRQFICMHSTHTLTQHHTKSETKFSEWLEFYYIGKFFCKLSFSFIIVCLLSVNRQKISERYTIENKQDAYTKSKVQKFKIDTKRCRFVEIVMKVFVLVVIFFVFFFWLCCFTPSSLQCS